jgi:hypothetical protein
MARMTTLTPNFWSALILILSKAEKGANQSDTAAGNDAFFNRCAGGIEGVFNAGFLLFHFGFGCRADVDHGHAADQFGQTFLQLLTVVIGSGLIDLSPDLFDTAFQCGARTGTIDDGGIVFVDADALGFAQVGKGQVLHFDAQVFAETT